MLAQKKNTEKKNVFERVFRNASDIFQVET